MRVVILGATGNVGTSLIQGLGDEPAVEEVAGVARRVPDIELPKTTWVPADISSDDLTAVFRGADVVVHLAWLIQPSRRTDILWRTNVAGTRRVLDAAVVAKVPALVYASSVGAYSPGPKDRRVDESWPTGGVGTLAYSRHKAEVERILDDFERDNAQIRIVRLRTALVFKQESATGQRRLFAGPALPASLIRPGLIRVVPDVPGLRSQVVHAYDAAQAYRRAVVSDVRGPFNVATEPVVDPSFLADFLGARKLRLRPGALRGFVDLTYRLHVQPSPPGWIDLALSAPIMDTSRARDELGWSPRHSAADTVRDLLRGMREQRGFGTPPLAPSSSGPARIREWLTGPGRREGL